MHGLPARLTRTGGWDRAVWEAEQLVGGPPVPLTALLRPLLQDQAGLGPHLRRLAGTGHPVLTTVKRLVYQAGFSGP